jgi:TRAP-type C4-dicarboxylate transport system permease small subunit
MRRIVRAIDANFEYVLGSALYAYIILVIFCEVVARYGFHSSILWAEETSIYAFIWLTYISMANLAKTRSHLAFTAIRDMLPPPGQLALLLLADVCLLILSTVIIIFVYHPLADNILFEQQMMGANLPLWWATAAVPFGWLLVGIRVIQRSLISIKKYMAGESLLSEVAALE